MEISIKENDYLASGSSLKKKALIKLLVFVDVTFMVIRNIGKICFIGIVLAKAIKRIKD